MCRYSPPSALRLRPLLVLLAVLGLQLMPLRSSATAVPGEETRLAAALPVAGVPLPAGAVDLEKTDRGGPAGCRTAHRYAVPARATAHGGACTRVFGDWLTSDLLDRAGRRSAPLTAPPASPV